MAYNVKIDVFEGPFDLLLHLVRANEMDIYDIPIAGIADQYLKYIQEMEELNLEVAGDFLVMAATLINLKSRTLMPLPTDDEDEEEIDEELEDIRSAQDLMRRLIEYRQFKELSSQLADREEEQLRRFYRNTILPVLTDGSEPAEFQEDISLLFSAFARVLEYVEGRPAHHILEEEFSVDEKMELIKGQVASRRRVGLFELFERCVSKREAVTLFLALLECCRLRQVRVWQGANFNEIYLIDPSEPEDEDD